jgi:hypothetical protein
MPVTVIQEGNDYNFSSRYGLSRSFSWFSSVLTSKRWDGVLIQSTVFSLLIIPNSYIVIIQPFDAIVTSAVQLNK